MKDYDEPIEVQVRSRDKGVPELNIPVAFHWRGRQYLVSRLMQYWRETTENWDPIRAKRSECFRVEADGGTYDLRYETDRVRSESAPGIGWRLSKVWD